MNRFHRALQFVLRVLKWRAHPLVLLLALALSALAGTVLVSAMELVLRALQSR